MKRIGILTFHRSINYGAFMQAYSLSKRLQRDYPDCIVEVIDYTTRRIQRKYSANPIVFIFSSICEMKKGSVLAIMKATVKNLTLCLMPGFLERRRQMKAAFAAGLQYLPLSSVSMETDNYKSFFKSIHNRYDVIVVGSDCVWEINHYPFPNAYYLHDAGGAVKMSYAACAEGTKYSDLTENQKTHMAESWDSFAYLGVRDAATERLLHSVDPSYHLHHNCDPTVFLNMDELPTDIEEIRRKFENVGVDFSRPVIGLMGSPKIGKICRTLFGGEYQIVAFYEENPYADVYLPDLNPFEWAKCFSLFSLVLTTKFHGTLLALKNGVPPLTFDYLGSYYTRTDGMTKIKDLYERLDLAEHYIIGKPECTKDELAAIHEKALRFMNAPPKEQIGRALESEAGSYESFCDVLKQYLCEESNC